MPNVKSILKQLNEGQDIKVVRAAIADLIEHHLQAFKKPLQYWQKANFADAIDDIERSINSNHQPTTGLLKLCLLSIEKALAPEDQRNDTFTAQDKQLEALTHEQLIERIKSLRQKGC